MNWKFGTLLIAILTCQVWSKDHVSYLPHYTFKDGLWETKVSIRNTTATSQSLRIKAFDNEGNLISQTGLTFEANGGTVQPVNTLVPNLTADVGWLEFRAEGDYFQGIMVFTYLSTGGTSSLPLVSGSHHNIVLPLLESSPVWQSGFSLTNISPSYSQVHLKLIDFATQKTLEQTVILPGHTKMVRMLSDIFEQELPEQASMIIHSSEPLIGFALTFGHNQSQIVAIPASIAPEDPETSRIFLKADDLFRDQHVPGGPVDLRYFSSIGSKEPAQHAFSGVLTLAETTMFSPNPNANEKIFPGFSSEFFSVGDDLVPVKRGILDSEQGNSAWQIVLSPGKIWSEGGGETYSRGAFPFILTDLFTNRAHNGVATFVYDEQTISNISIQISQENAAWSIYDYWALLPASYEPGPIKDVSEQRDLFSREQSFQWDILDFEELHSPLGSSASEVFLDGSDPENVSAACVIKNGNIYLQPMVTRHGYFPYPRQNRLGVFSWAKSMAASVAMLRLAQKYGATIYSHLISNYIEITSHHSGWEGVTFGDCLNMATGVGEYAPDPNAEGWEVLADDGGPLMDQFISAPTTKEKLDACFSFGNYDWGPGEHLRYSSYTTFILSVAMDRYFKRVEGSEARLWDMLVQEVYEPIGVFHSPMQYSLDTSGQKDIPVLAWGMFPTVDDIAKVVELFRNGGYHDGQQLLHAQKTAQAMFLTQEIGLPVQGSDEGAGPVTYQMGFWSMAEDLGEGPFRFPAMLGYGGNWLLFLPGATCFRIQDDFNMKLDGMQAVTFTLPE